MHWSGFLTVACAVAALTSSARADDAPGLALAKRVVDEIRGDEHKAKMRIVWPENVEATPPDGAEVVLIDGYIDYEMTRLVWRGGKVEARSVATARSWFYNPKGEGFGAREFDVDPAAFATAWTAALYVAGASEERIEPEPKDHPSSSSSSLLSHEPHRWARLRVGVESTPRFFGDARGENSRNWEGVRDWNGIRDGAVWECLSALVPKYELSRDASPSTWRKDVTDEIRRATTRLDLSDRSEHSLLLEVCLRVGGEVGDADTLAAVEAFDAARRAASGDDWVSRNVADEIEIARTKLSLLTAWDSKRAAELIRTGGHEKHWQEDLTKWVRRRLREKDPQAYASLLVEAIDTVLPRYDKLALLEEVREARPSAASASLRRCLGDLDADVRVEAARALLAIDPKDESAGAVLVRAVDDARIVPESHGLKTPKWRRLDALNECVDRGLLSAKDVRTRLDGATNPALIRGFLVALRRTKEPPTDDEARVAWRRLLGAVRGDDALDAAEALLDLHDIEGRVRLVETLDRWTDESWGCVATRQRAVALRTRLDKEMPAATPPK
jgi:hypothetical protein